MNILVCLKQILDPEIPARDFRVDGAARGRARQREPGDEHLLRKRAGDRPASPRHAWRQDHRLVLRARFGRRRAAQGAGAQGRRCRAGGQRAPGTPDPLAVARALAAAARKLGEFDVLLVGREAGDWGAGQTGGLVAEELGLPCIAFAESLAPGSAPGTVEVKRQTDTGWEVYEVRTPLVATITNHDKNVPRIPKTRDVMQSYRKPLRAGASPNWASSRRPLIPKSPSCSSPKKKPSASSSKARRSTRSSMPLPPASPKSSVRCSRVRHRFARRSVHSQPRLAEKPSCPTLSASCRPRPESIARPKACWAPAAAWPIAPAASSAP